MTKPLANFGNFEFVEPVKGATYYSDAWKRMQQNADTPEFAKWNLRQSGGWRHWSAIEDAIKDTDVSFDDVARYIDRNELPANGDRAAIVEAASRAADQLRPSSGGGLFGTLSRAAGDVIGSASKNLINPIAKTMQENPALFFGAPFAVAALSGAGPLGLGGSGTATGTGVGAANSASFAAEAAPAWESAILQSSGIAPGMSASGLALPGAATVAPATGGATFLSRAGEFLASPGGRAAVLGAGALAQNQVLSDVGKEDLPNEASDMQDQITREQWQHFLDTYAPLEREALDRAMQTDFTDEGNESSAIVRDAFRVGRGTQERSFQRLGVNLSQEEREAIKRRSTTMSSAAQAGAENVTRRTLKTSREDALQTLIGIGRGVANTGLSGISAAADTAASRNIAQQQIDAQKKAARASAIGTAVGIGLNFI